MPGVRRSIFVRFVLVLGTLGTVAVVPACGDDDAACDSAKCAAGNKCLPLDGVTECRKTCSSNFDKETNCPPGYTCVASQPGVEAFCVQNTARVNGQPITPGPKQWGSPCNPTKGIQGDDCDVAQGFFCYGQSPNDGSAYCTRYDCQSDRDCTAGYWCATVNETPNVERQKRTSIGATVRVCARRGFCDPCVADFDCPTLNGARQRCIPDDAGQGMCTPECISNQARSTCSADCIAGVAPRDQCPPECQGVGACPTEAGCADAGIGVNICYPRARVCLGDGSLCAPCRSDLDCGDDGICVRGQYTSERTCAKKSATSCAKGESRGSCPEKVGSTNILCLGGLVTEVEPDYCHGIYLLGNDGGGDVGCFTPNR